METNVYLPEDVAIREYQRLKLEAARRSEDGDLQAGVEPALFRMWELYTAPYRVVRFDLEKGDHRPRFVVFLVEGHGLEYGVWELKGHHRELDAVRLSVLLRNQWLMAKEQALEAGKLGWTLESRMPAVRELLGPEDAETD